MARATASESIKRVDRLQIMLLEGTSNSECLMFARQTWGSPERKANRLLKKAWVQIREDINQSGVDRQEVLSWSIQTLMAAAGKAIKQNNPGAVVSAIRQLDHMTGVGYNSHRGVGMRKRY